ncbi:MAG TPA: hypothetical protein VGS19_37640 [Streptosporangiaceae bacterium]|nr:hypothetical protein [Streptosporangiaceae bacterium]
MNEATTLERRYRWLLTAYPSHHRQAHSEEMVGVLLASSGPRQRWPRAADAADLLAGALRIRFRAWRGRADDGAWRDALAVVSVIAPILVLAAALAYADLYGVAIRSATGSPEVPFWLADPWTWPVTFGPAIVTLLALLGLRRSVAVASLVTTATWVVPQVYAYPSYLYSPGTALQAYLGLLTAVAAVLSPGPRRGTEILRWWGVTAVAVTAAGLAELSKGTEFDIPLMRGVTPLLVSAGILMLAAVVCLITPAGRRVLVLLAVPGLPYGMALLRLAGSGPQWWPTAISLTAVLGLPALLALCVITIAVIRVRAGRRLKAPPEDARPAG